MYGVRCFEVVEITEYFCVFLFHGRCVKYDVWSGIIKTVCLLSYRMVSGDACVVLVKPACEVRDVVTSSIGWMRLFQSFRRSEPELKKEPVIEYEKTKELHEDIAHIVEVQVGSPLNVIGDEFQEIDIKPVVVVKDQSRGRLGCNISPRCRLFVQLLLFVSILASLVLAYLIANRV